MLFLYDELRRHFCQAAHDCLTAVLAVSSVSVSKQMRTSAGTLPLGEIAILVTGAALRIWYFVVTPLGSRGHDLGAHLDYITYLITHGALPAVNAGWEFHQAPLYYVISAMLWIATAGHTLENPPFMLLHGISALLSIATLAIGLCIGRMLFADLRARLTFGLMIATLPGMIYLIGELGNEPLHTFLAFLGFFLLLRWWKSGTTKHLVATVVIISIGILTKITSFILAAALLVCIVLRPKTQRKKKWASLGIAVAILSLLCGWFAALRISEHDMIQQRLRTNATMELVQRMHLENDLSFFLQFSPAMIVGRPFNDVFDPDQRRFFWEYLFRSAWFGEWTFSSVQPLASVMLALGLAMLCFVLAGAWRDIHERPPYAFPVALTAILLPLGLVTYRLLLACACNQDFRFISLIAVPMTYYALRGIGLLPKRFRIIGETVAWLMALTSTVFILLL